MKKILFCLIVLFGCGEKKDLYNKDVSLDFSLILITNSLLLNQKNDDLHKYGLQGMQNQKEYLLCQEYIDFLSALDIDLISRCGGRRDGLLAHPEQIKCPYYILFLSKDGNAKKFDLLFEKFLADSNREKYFHLDYRDRKKYGFPNSNVPPSEFYFKDKNLFDCTLRINFLINYFLLQQLKLFSTSSRYVLPDSIKSN